MNTQTTTNVKLLPPVSQLAKTYLPTQKPSIDNGLTVGRHEDISLTCEGAQTYAPDFKVSKLTESEDLQAMTYLNHLFSGLLPDVKVVFHNLLYVEQIQEGFLPRESDLFFQFVKTFAQFRTANHLPHSSDIVLTNDNDFYLAFKLMRKRKLSDYKDIKPKNKNKVLDLIKLKFSQRTFTPKIIAQELFYNYAFIHRILALLILEQEVEFVKDFGEQKVFRLRQKSTIHVTRA